MTSSFLGVERFYLDSMRGYSNLLPFLRHLLALETRRSEKKRTSQEPFLEEREKGRIYFFFVLACSVHASTQWVALKVRMKAGSLENDMSKEGISIRKGKKTGSRN